MSNEENKRIVAQGLERRKADREAAQQESRLEQYEQDMITTCNAHCADAKIQTRMDETGRLQRMEWKALQEKRREALRKEREREADATEAVRRFCLICFAIAMVATWTPIEWWAAAALIAGLAVFPVVYIYRLYNPIEEVRT